MITESNKGNYCLFYKNSNNYIKIYNNGKAEISNIKDFTIKELEGVFNKWKKEK